MTNITERIRQAVSPTLQGVLREAGILAYEMGYRFSCSDALSLDTTFF